MYFKLLLSEEENKELESRAKSAGLDKTAYIKSCLKLEASEQNIYTVQYAVTLAKKKWPKGKPFTLSELYGDEWLKVPNGIAGVLGRNFYNFVTTTDSGITVLDRKEVSINAQKRMQNQYLVQ